MKFRTREAFLAHEINSYQYIFKKKRKSNRSTVHIHLFTTLRFSVGFSCLWRRVSEDDRTQFVCNFEMYCIVNKISKMHLQQFLIELWLKDVLKPKIEKEQCVGMHCRPLSYTHGFRRRLNLEPLRLGNPHWIYSLESPTPEIHWVYTAESVFTIWLSLTLDLVCISA